MGSFHAHNLSIRLIYATSNFHIRVKRKKVRAGGLSFLFRSAGHLLPQNQNEDQPEGWLAFSSERTEDVEQ
jgi:hypothetical protein